MVSITAVGPELRGFNLYLMSADLSCVKNAEYSVFFLLLLYLLFFCSLFIGYNHGAELAFALVSIIYIHNN